MVDEVAEDLKERGYQTEKKIVGDGSYAVVGRYHRESDGKKVAIKIIDRRKTSQRFLQQFLPRELEIGELIDHRNLVRIFEWFEIGSRTFIVMELAGKGDLEQLISKEGAFKEDKRSPNDKPHLLFRQILDAVAYLHNTLGIVHRDLKCENVFLNKDFEPKIGDFGFARKMGTHDLSKTFCGSRAYASPELLQQKPYRGRAIDMWSLGVILFIVLEGRMPFDDRNLSQMINRALKQKIPYGKKSKTSKNARDLIQKLLEPEIDKRLDCIQSLRHKWFCDRSKSSDSYTPA